MYTLHTMGQLLINLLIRRVDIQHFSNYWDQIFFKIMTDLLSAGLLACGLLNSTFAYFVFCLKLVTVAL